MKKGALSNCDGPKKDNMPTPTPVVVNKASCRLCDSCGGQYPVNNGQALKVGDWGWWKSYDASCSGSLTDKSNKYSVLPSLCCT